MKIYLSILAVLLTSCTSNHAHLDQQMQDILGVWHLKDFHDYGYSFSQIAYLKNGTKCEIALDFPQNGGKEINFYINHWKIENGYLISTVEDSNLPYIPKGDLITDAIHKLTDKELVVLMQPKHEDDFPYTFEMERHIKIEGEDPNMLCRIVEANLKIHHSNADGNRR